MGNPLNYSLELPQRCMQLIDGAWEHVSKTYPQGNNELGPMTSTFLLSMSMPIINIPIERIERHRGNADQYYINDRLIDENITAAIDDIIGGREFGKCPFFMNNCWRFYKLKVSKKINIADGLPHYVAAALNDAKAVEEAAKMDTSQWCSVLRNALAHGGIAYLDESGHSSWGKPVKMYAFASGKYDEESPDRPKPLIAVNFLRISEFDYREFLRSWVKWLEESGIARALEAA